MVLAPSPTATQEVCAGNASEKKRSADELSLGTFSAKTRSFCGETKMDDDTARVVRGCATDVLEVRYARFSTLDGKSLINNLRETGIKSQLFEGFLGSITPTCE
jgi:hypothetical protein